MNAASDRLHLRRSVDRRIDRAPTNSGRRISFILPSALTCVWFSPRQNLLALTKGGCVSLELWKSGGTGGLESRPKVKPSVPVATDDERLTSLVQLHFDSDTLAKCTFTIPTSS